MEKTWAFNEDELGAALDAWAKHQRPNEETRRAVIAISTFLNSSAAGKLRANTSAHVVERTA